MKVIYHVFQARHVYGGPFPGEWLPGAAYSRLEDVKTFLKIKQANIKKFETRYETKPDNHGCYDLFRVEVDLDLEGES